MSDNDKNKVKKTKNPRKLKGFNDFFAEDMQIREYVINIFKEVFEKYGYEPLETPALEYTELLLGQSGEEAENQFYRFEDSGGRDVMMKYEVMTAMCRAVGENIGTLPLPYKRYQIQRVWRAENTQKGRYRELTQCDADTVGSSEMICDGEAIAMGLEVTGRLGFKDFIVRINNRKVIEGLNEYLEIEKDKFYGFCISLDKLQKIGKERVIKEMSDKRGINRQKAEQALAIVEPKQYENANFTETINMLRDTAGQNVIGSKGLDELEEVGQFLSASGIDSSLYTFDPSLARGLAHYTGPVWEFEVQDSGVGSISGGGRYDDVIGEYVGRKIPATGTSFGIERVCDIIKDRNMLELKPIVDAMMIMFTEELWEETLTIANKLRDSELNVMLYPESDSLSKQFRYADRKNIPWVIIVGPEEVKNNTLQLKNMKSGDQKEESIDEAVKTLKK
jgi:histidyl-tRNA synthetase